MNDCVLLSASPKNILDCIALTEQHPGLGIEVMNFAFPHVLDSPDRPSQQARYRDLLASVRARGGKITMHGAFMDLPAGSPDPLISAVVAQRFTQAVTIAADIGAEVVVLHANFIGQILTDDYRRGWQQRNLTFWQPIADAAAQHGVTIAIENMWEFDPTLIGDVLGTLDHPHLRACIDVGHAHLYSLRQFAFADWVRTLAPYLVHAHVNNNDGIYDIHRALPDGILDYAPLLDRLRALPIPPSFTLEMDAVEDMAASLPYFELTRVSGD